MFFEIWFSFLIFLVILCSLCWEGLGLLEWKFIFCLMIDFLVWGECCLGGGLRLSFVSIVFYFVSCVFSFFLIESVWFVIFCVLLFLIWVFNLSILLCSFRFLESISEYLFFSLWMCSVWMLFDLVRFLFWWRSFFLIVFMY